MKPVSRRLGLPRWMVHAPWSGPGPLLGPHYGTEDLPGILDALGGLSRLEIACRLSGPSYTGCLAYPKDAQEPTILAWLSESFLRLWTENAQERLAFQKALPDARTTLWMELTPWARLASQDGAKLRLWMKNTNPMADHPHLAQGAPKGYNRSEGASA